MSNKFNQFISINNSLNANTIHEHHHNNTIIANNHVINKTLVKPNRSILQYHVQLLNNHTNTRVPCKLLIHLIHSTITLTHCKNNTTNTDTGSEDHTSTLDEIIPPEYTQLYSYNTPISLQCVKQIEWYKSESNRLVLIIVPITNNDTIKSQIWDLLYISSDYRERCYHVLIRKCSRDIVVKHLTGDYQSHWLADNASNICMQCHHEFTLLKRRSHCRSCGKLFCHDCSNNTSFIESLGYTARPVRVCDTCYNTLQSTDNNSAHIHPQLIQPAAIDSMAIDHSARDHTQCIAFTRLQRHTLITYDNTTIKRDRYGFRIFNHNKIDSKQQRFDIIQQYNRWNTYLSTNTHMCLHNKSTQELIKYGIVPEYRAGMWLHFSGATQLKLQYSNTYYNDLLLQSESLNDGIIGEIEKDLTRTFPYHQLFESVDGLALLRRLLIAFSQHNRTVSYCQSMNFIAAILLIVCQSNEIDAFWLLCIVVDKLTAVHNNNNSNHTNIDVYYYYQRDLAGAHIDQHVFDILIKQHLPQIHNKLTQLQIPLLPLTINWFLCLFINVVPIDQYMCIWDMLFVYNNNIHVIFSTSLLLLQLNQRQIIQSTDFEQCLYNIKYQSYNLSTQQFIDKLFTDWLNNKIQYHTVIQLRQQYITTVLHQLQSRQQHRRNMTLRKSLQSTKSNDTCTTDNTNDTAVNQVDHVDTSLDTSVQLEYADKFELNLIDEYYKIANSPSPSINTLTNNTSMKSNPSTPHHRKPIRIDTINNHSSANRQRVYSDLADRSNPADNHNQQSPTMSELDATVEELVDLGKYISLSVRSIGKRLTSPSKYNINNNTSGNTPGIFSYDTIDIHDESIDDNILNDDKLSDIET